MSAPDRRSRFPASQPRQGGRSGDAPLTIVERPATLVQVNARKGRQAELVAAIAKTLALALPDAGRTATAADMAALWLQPGSWLIEAPAGRRGELPGTLAQTLNGIAAVVDQSHGRCVIEISGAEARAVLARLCRLDLHERAFAAGDSAATLVGHVSCLIHRTGGEAPCFRLVVGSTFAEWLLHELTAAAASYGWRFTPAGEAAA
ncbi:hypothetical protein ASE66_04185 [Bosea sp. Root483D1]|uniref:sarcosine oxidase subunit gamma n=1 Tax=Bosea sp. Root483D1 TaxID=1736544 RepID=UPI00070EE084|nr:sarcosine oxidase subunit gamma family protein [Bosea sp. Root483D1]KRE24435.1 hypothetical protein ASE66_04185 [Bosea sp. Root483D1]